MNYVDKISNCKPEVGELAIFWLGQAGFLIKNSKGKALVLDPYLTNCVERLSGHKRLMASVLEPEELIADVYLCTHSHDDHLDVDAAPIIMKNSNTTLLGPQSVITLCEGLGIESSQLICTKENDVNEICGYKITTVYADHGNLEPYAVGFLVESEAIKIYFTGDTANRPEQMKSAIYAKPDIIVFPINGEFGNMNCIDAAKLACSCVAKIAIPSHFWTLAIHRGNPFEFEPMMKQYAPNCMPKLMCQGEQYIHKNEKQ